MSRAPFQDAGASDDSGGCLASDVSCSEDGMELWLLASEAALRRHEALSSGREQD